MSENDFKVQWSLSLPPRAQYAKGDMLNIRGASVSEVEALFDSILNGEFLDKATSVGALLGQAFIAAEGINVPAPGAGEGEKSNSAPDAPAGDGKFCEHGKRSYKDGHGKKGHWEGWFCPSKKCDPIWG